jgi:adenylate kinase
MTRRFWLLAAGGCSWSVAQQRKTIVVLVGPPGSGKTTHAKLLKKEFGLPIISGETLIRESRDNRRGELRQLKGTPLEYGEGIDDELMNSLIRQRALKSDCANGFILDGFPRSAAQSQALRAMAAESGVAATVVIHLKADDATIRQRMQARGKSYDDPATVEERIRTYRREEEAVLASIDKSRLVEVDANQPEKQVSAAIRAAVQQYR